MQAKVDEQSHADNNALVMHRHILIHDHDFGKD